MDDSTSNDAQADAFHVARRGYDRRQVDAYREANEARIETLERHIQGLEGNMSELGLTRPVDLAAELDVVGEEVKRILQEARVAAEQMRSRAADDAARWRAEADEESRALRDSARVVAYETRRSVWETGSEMLASAAAARETVTASATQHALFVQAEAEREASRLVGDARRERDESVGGAREEADQLVAAARHESDSIMSDARRQADVAQERARALELRRAELMAELETARATIAGNEVEPTPDATPEEASVEPVTATTSVEAADDVRSHWPEDEGSVKIVSAARVLAAEPVDADAMVAEVEAMRKVPSPQPESEPSSVLPPDGSEDAEERSDDAGGQESDEPPVASPESESDPDPEPEPDPELEVSSSPSGGGVAEGDGGGQESDQPPATSHEPEPESEAEPEVEQKRELEVESRSEAESEPEMESEPEPESDPVPEPDPLAGLFAQLREPAADETSVPVLASPPSGGGSDEEAVGGQTPDAPDGPDAEDGGGQESAKSPVAGPRTEIETTNESGLDLDPFALRERHLLPVQNRSLRTVKRQLVEAQNQALENLRLIEGWEPDETIVDGEVAEALRALARESLVAGFAAAAEMMGTDESPQPSDVDPGDPSVEFSGALLETTRSTVARLRDAGAGHRETASSLSRVFRSWRTDEAERRVRFASRTAYHVGVAAALSDLGATDLAIASSGRPCPECPANRDPWTITDGLPDGTVMPPARLECACTIIPSP